MHRRRAIVLSLVVVGVLGATGTVVRAKLE